MSSNPAVPFWDEGNTFTGHAQAAVTGKRFVTITGARVDGNPRVGHAINSATSISVGVSGFDAAAGAKVTVYSSPGIVMPVTAAVSLVAGDLVYSDASGKAVKVAPSGAVIPAGVALDDAAADADAVIKLL